MSDKPVTLKNQLACAVRESERRARVYPKAVRDKKINPHVAAYETRAMEAIVASLQKLVWLEEVSEEMKTRP